MPAEIELPPYVTVLDWRDDGRALLSCKNPRHLTPRDYVSRTGERGAQCPLCLAISILDEDSEHGDAA